MNQIIIYYKLLQPILSYFILINIIGVLLMGLDKYQAIKQSSRIAEKYFVLISFLGGFVGVYLGMKMFRHKTLKTSFQIKILGAFLLFLLIIYL